MEEQGASQRDDQHIPELLEKDRERQAGARVLMLISFKTT
jgi:hypothetical protein